MGKTGGRIKLPSVCKRLGEIAGYFRSEGTNGNGVNRCPLDVDRVRKVPCYFHRYTVDRSIAKRLSVRWNETENSRMIDSWQRVPPHGCPSCWLHPREFIRLIGDTGC